MRLDELHNSILEARSKYNPDPSEFRLKRDNSIELAPFLKQGYYASFTILPKLGINPKSRFATPLGIYAYHLGNEATQYAIRTNSLPYASDRPFVNIFTTTGNIVDLDENDDWPWTKITNHFVSLFEIDPDDVGVIKHMLIFELLPYAKDTARSGRMASIFWNFTRLLSILIKELKTNHRGRYTPDDLHDDIELIKNGSNRHKSAPAIWSSIFLAAGIDGFVDTMGVIHENEPEQAVFFNPRMIRLVARIENEWDTNNKSIFTVDSPDTLKSALAIMTRHPDSYEPVTFIWSYMMGRTRTLYPHRSAVKLPTIFGNRGRNSPDERLYEYTDVILSFFRNHPNQLYTYQAKLPEYFGEICALMSVSEDNFHAIEDLANLVQDRTEMLKHMIKTVIRFSSFKMSDRNYVDRALKIISRLAQSEEQKKMVSTVFGDINEQL